MESPVKRRPRVNHDTVTDRGKELMKLHYYEKTYGLSRECIDSLTVDQVKIVGQFHKHAQKAIRSDVPITIINKIILELIQSLITDKIEGVEHEESHLKH